MPHDKEASSRATRLAVTAWLTATLTALLIAPFAKKPSVFVESAAMVFVFGSANVAISKARAAGVFGLWAGIAANFVAAALLMFLAQWLRRIF